MHCHEAVLVQLLHTGIRHAGAVYTIRHALSEILRLCIERTAWWLRSKVIGWILISYRLCDLVDHC